MPDECLGGLLKAKTEIRIDYKLSKTNLSVSHCATHSTPPLSGINCWALRRGMSGDSGFGVPCVRGGTAVLDIAARNEDLQHHGQRLVPGSARRAAAGQL